MGNNIICCVEVESYFVVLKTAVHAVDPSAAIGQHAGFPAGDRAVGQVDPGRGRQANAAAVPAEIQMVKVADRTSVDGNLGIAGKDGPPLLTAQKVDPAAGALSAASWAGCCGRSGDKRPPPPEDRCRRRGSNAAVRVLFSSLSSQNASINRRTFL